MKKYKLRLLMLTLPLVVLIAVTGLALRLSGVTQPDSAHSLPMPQQLKSDDFWPEQQGVLHVTIPVAASDTAAKDSTGTEIWFDPRNMRARQETRLADGTISYLATADGDHYGSYDQRTKAILQRRLLDNGGWEYWLQYDGDVVMGEAIVNRNQTSVERTTLEGVDVFKFQVPVMDENGQRETTETYYLDSATGLPIRFESKSTGEDTKNSAQDVKYGVIEWLPQDKVDAGLFKLSGDLPDVDSTTTETYMTIDEAQKFSEFDTYYLGDSFQGAKLYAFLDYVEVSKNISAHYFDADYSLDGTPATPVLQVTSSLPETVKDPWNSPRSSTKRDVTVHGVAGFLYPPESLWLQIGNTVIHVSARDKMATEEILLAAGDGLMRLNQ